MFAILTYKKDYGKDIIILDVKDENIEIIDKVKFDSDTNILYFDIDENNVFCDKRWCNEKVRSKETSLFQKHYKFDKKLIKYVPYFSDFHKDDSNCFEHLDLFLEQTGFFDRKHNHFKKIVVGCENIGDYHILILYDYSGKNTIILIIDENKKEIMKQFVFKLIFQGMKHSYYINDDIINFAFCIEDINGGFTEYIKVISVNLYGYISEYDIENTCIDKNIKYINAMMHKNYIIYHNQENGFVYIYDYINKKIICKSSIVNDFNIIGFVKLKEHDEKSCCVMEWEKDDDDDLFSYLERNDEYDEHGNNYYSEVINDMYYNDITKDIEIETNNGNIWAHKCVLFEQSTYFKKLLSNDFLNINRITFNTDCETIKLFLDLIYLNELRFDGNIVKLLNLKKFCALINYTDSFVEK